MLKDSVTVQLKQIKRTDMATFLFLVHKQSNRQGGARAVDLPARSFDLARPGVAPPLIFCTVFYSFAGTPILIILPCTLH